VANLIRQGRSSKEIAKMLNVSTAAISFHRHNLRKKMGLLNKKTTLRSHLQSLTK
jgi:DNA-binding CsgD family transcriptional regulator